MRVRDTNGKQHLSRSLVKRVASLFSRQGGHSHKESAGDIEHYETSDEEAEYASSRKGSSI